MAKLSDLLKKIFEEGDTISGAVADVAGKITTDKFSASNHVGTIRKIKKKKNGEMEYEYAGNGLKPATKNPDGSEGPLFNIQSRKVLI